MLKHEALLKTCELTLESHDTDSDTVKPAVLVFYTHHRPHLASRDMQFFEKAKSSGWKCEKVVTERYPVSNMHTYAALLFNSFLFSFKNFLLNV